MKKIITNWRYPILAAVITIAILGLVAVPGEGVTMKQFALQMLASKVIGLIAGLAAWMLYNYWSSKDEISELTNLVNED